MRKAPRVSVLMPVFNGEAFLRQSVDSILAQTFRDFELIVVDDGSSDESYSLLAEYAQLDERVKLIRNDINIGIAGTLNNGLRECRGEYIARMDADDVSLPQRLEKQLAFMDRSPDVGLCGALFRLCGAAEQVSKYPSSDAGIKIEHLLRDSAIGHPTVFMRRTLLETPDHRYRQEDFPAEDLWLWIRLGLVTKLANLPEVLLNYRVHPEQISNTKRGLQRIKALSAQAFFAGHVMGAPLTDREIRLHGVLSGLNDLADGSELHLVHDYSAALVRANRRTDVVDQPLLEEKVNERLASLPAEYAHACFRNSSRYDLALLSRFIRDPLRPARTLSVLENLKFVVKCGMRYERPTKS
jgi:glycosyltransferase involved in cell wall biosynthesis